MVKQASTPGTFKDVPQQWNRKGYDIKFRSWMDMLKYTDFCAKQAHISVQKLKTWLSEWGLVWGRRKRKSTPKKRMYQLITRENPISSESSATTQLTTWSWIVSMWSERWSQVPLAIFVVLLLHNSLFESDLGAYCRHDCTWFVGYLHGGRSEFSWNACSIRACVQGPFEKASPRSCARNRSWGRQNVSEGANKSR